MFSRFNQLEDEDTFRIVGFEINPRSIAIATIPETKGNTCVGDLEASEKQFITPDTKEIKFSYDVVWKVSCFSTLLKLFFYCRT